MTTQTHSGKAENAGVRLGRAWWSFRRWERQFAAWLGARGVPARATASLFWIAKLAVVAAVLYSFLAVGIILLALLVVGHLLQMNLSEEEERPKWDYGLFGYGLYDRKGERLDPHDPNKLP